MMLRILWTILVRHIIRAEWAWKRSEVAEINLLKGTKFRSNRAKWTRHGLYTLAPWLFREALITKEVFESTERRRC